MDGISKFVNPTDNTISITFDDQKTDEAKIVQALTLGGVTIQGNRSAAP